MSTSEAERDAPGPGRVSGGHRLVVLVACVLCALGLSAGSEGWSLQWSRDWALLTDIRAPRTLGAFLCGSLLGLAGALAQGLFRNPLADPYLLGSASGAGLAVVLMLAAAQWAEASLHIEAAGAATLGLTAAAFVGALGGVALTLALAPHRGASTSLLLAGVVVGVVLAALSDLATILTPGILQGRYSFLLGTTALLGWNSVALLFAAAGFALMAALPRARALDALTLGEETAISLGVELRRERFILVLVVALCTGAAVAQAGLIAFVGLVAPHLVRRYGFVMHRDLLVLSALVGGMLLLAADITARVVISPAELPVGVLTAALGGAYLLVLLRTQDT